MNNIIVEVLYRVAIPEEGKSIVCGNSDYTITFELDAEWADKTVRTARFVWSDKNGDVKFIDQPFTGNVVAVPVLSDISQVYVGLYAGDLCTTTPALISCKRSILCGGGTHEPPSEDVYNKIMKMIQDGMLQGPPGEPGPQGPQGEPGEGGAKEIVYVDLIHDLIIPQDVDKFNELTERMRNNEILVFGYHLGMQNYGVVSLSELAGHGTAWEILSAFTENEVDTVITRTTLCLKNQDGDAYISGSATTGYLMPLPPDLLVKTGVVRNTETLTADEQKSARDWLGAVGQNDIGSASKAGLIKAGGSTYYGFVISPNGIPYVSEYSLKEYNERAYPVSFIGKQTLENVKGDIVKRAVTEDLIALTEEEKAKWKAFLENILN